MDEYVFNYCNLCGKPMDMFDNAQGNHLEHRIGYGSEHDGENLNLHICCDCMDEIINRCVVSPLIGD